MKLSALKALAVGGITTTSLYMLVIWIIPLFSYLVIFGIISLISFAVITEEEKNKRPPQK